MADLLGCWIQMECRLPGWQCQQAAWRLLLPTAAQNSILLNICHYADQCSPTDISCPHDHEGMGHAFEPVQLQLRDMQIRQCHLGLQPNYRPIGSCRCQSAVQHWYY